MPDRNETLRAAIVAALKSVHDPEIPINIHDLGLIYDLDVHDDGTVDVTMTLTTPNCPVADKLPAMVREAVRGVDGVQDARVELTWTPAWSGERMSEDARMTLEMMGIDWSDPHRSATSQSTPLTIKKTPDRRSREP